MENIQKAFAYQNKHIFCFYLYFTSQIFLLICYLDVSPINIINLQINFIKQHLLFVLF